MRIYRIIGLLGLSLMLVLSGCDFLEDGAPEIPADGDWVSAYAAYVQEEMAYAEVPGLALALIEGDEVVLVEGYGLRDVERDLPVTADTLFHIGSTHKALTSMLVATLVDDGLITWDTPVAQVAPQFELADPDYTRDVAFRHLLNMTSGIPDDAEDELPEFPTPQDVFDAAYAVDPLDAPGEAFSYSNISASLAGYAAVIAAGGSERALYQGYADLLRARVLAPIGMDAATLSVDAAQSRADFAYSYAIEGGEPVRTPTYDVENDALAPSGALKASVREMARFVLTQMQGGVAPNGTRVVSAATLAATWEPHLEDYALGWAVTERDGVTMIWHTGAYDDFASAIGFIPEFDVGFVILTNSEAALDLTEEAPIALLELLLEL